MPNNVNKTPTDSALSAYASGETVTAIKTKRWTDQLDYLLGFNLPVVASTCYQGFQSETAVNTGESRLSYWKSPGAAMLLIEAEVQTYESITQLEGTTSGKTCHLDITPPSGSVWVGYSPFDTSISGVSRSLNYPLPSNGQYQVYRGFLDVTNVTTASIQTITASFTNLENSGSTSTGHGFQRITVMEVPRSFLLGSGETVGVKESWTAPGQQIVSQSADGTHGIAQVVKSMDKARVEVRKQFQFGSFYDDTSQDRCWRGTYGVDTDLDYKTPLTTRRYFHTKVRRTYGAAVSVPYTMRIHYKTSDAIYYYQVSVNWQAYGGGGSGYTYVTCPASTNWTYVDVSFSLPSIGTNQEVKLYLQSLMEEDPSQTIYIGNVYLAENQA